MVIPLPLLLLEVDPILKKLRMFKKKKKEKLKKERKKEKRERKRNYVAYLNNLQQK